MKPVLKIAFCDFWNGFSPRESIFWKILSEKYEPVLADEPQFLFCSCFGHEHLKYDCIKIFFTGECETPDFNLFDYAIGFDRISFSDRYLRFPVYLLKEESCRQMEEKHLHRTPKTAFCSFVYSNEQACGERDEFFNILSSRRRIDSGGRHNNNIGAPVEDKFRFLLEHKFDIAFENASHPGYTTEKIVESFAAGAIPVYSGDPDIGLTFNKAAFIDIDDFPTLEEAADEVLRIDSDEKAAEMMLSQPALVEGRGESYDEKVEELRVFLFRITESHSFKRSGGFWGKRYQRQALAREKAFRRSLPGLLSGIYKKTLWKSRRRNGFLWGIDKLTKSKR